MNVRQGIYIFIGFFMLGIQFVSGQHTYTSPQEDSLIIQAENDTLIRYRSLLLESPNNLGYVNEYLSKLVKYFRIETANELLVQYMDQAMSSDKPTELADFYTNWAEALQNSTQYDSSEAVFTLALNDPRIKELSPQLAFLNLSLGNTFRLKGEYYNAGKYLHEAIGMYKSLRDTFNVNQSQLQVGILHMIEQDHQQAEEIFSACLDYFKKAGKEKEVALELSIESILHHQRKEFDKAFETADQSLKIRYQQRDLRGQAESLNNLAINYLSRGKWESGLEMLREARRKFQLGGDLTYIPVILNNEGIAHSNLGQMDTALAYFKKAVKLGIDRNQKHAIMSGYFRMATHYEKTENFKDALLFYKKGMSQRSEILGEEKLYALSDLEDKLKDEARQQEFLQLERENHILDTRNIAYGIAALFFLIAGTLTVILLLMRSQRNKLLHQEEKKMLAQREAITQNKLIRAERELDDFVVQIIRKNDVVENLNSKVTELEGKLNTDIKERKKFEEELSKMKILTEEDWIQFRQHFVNAYPGYIERLNKVFPELSKGEARMFILHKLGFEPLQMGNILGISSAGIKKARYRLRKKLNLEEAIDLMVFIRDF